MDPAFKIKIAQVLLHNFLIPTQEIPELALIVQITAKSASMKTSQEWFAVITVMRDLN